MKRTITLLLALAMCIGLLPVSAFAQTMPFTDVRAEDYFYDAVSWAVDEAVTEGMTKTTFGPAVNCTRAHIVTFLWRMAGRPTPAQEDTAFVDVEDNAYYTTAVAWAVEQGITEGVDETHFNPEQECTRKEVAVFLWRFLGEEVPEAEESPFEDVKMTDWYGQAVTWAAEKEITNGRGNNRFETDDVCDRGQAVTFLYRVMKLLDRTDVPEPTEPTDSTEPSQSSGMKLEEDASTVTSGDMLRASTYALTNGTSTQANETTTLKYFNVTLFDYDTDTINNATHAADLAANSALTEWKGIYFNNGSPAASSYTYATGAEAHTDLTWQQVKNGTYYFDDTCMTQAIVEEVWGGTYEEVENVTCGRLISSNSNTWQICKNYYYQVDGAYYPLYAKRSDGTILYRYTWGYKASGASDVTLIKSEDRAVDWIPTITVYTESNSVVGYKLTAGGNTLATLNSTDLTQKVGVTLYSKAGTYTTASLPFAKYNWWNKMQIKDRYAENGQKFYTGLVADELDANHNIVFNEPEGGIFNSDASVKKIYNNVEMPFVYENGFYTFNSAENGVYFKQDTAQNSTSASATEKRRLYFDQGNPQYNQTGYADGSTNVWMPFDESNNFSGGNYHFGMIASIPFTMTPNGRINESNPESTPIEFSFSGDDDVWVFIDDELVIDLGGIHNRLDAKIDFAENTVTYSVSNNLASSQETGSYNDTDFELKQTLFENLITQDRTTFAASDVHTLTVFYLERGQGSSNCRISFNLPMKDNVTVTKIANQSWSETEQTSSSLTPEEQATVDRIDFGFTLYKDAGDDYVPVANTNYLLLDANKNVLATLPTDSNGHFTLKNGQSAKFITSFAAATKYYVVEDNLQDKGFYSPDYSFSGTAASGFEWSDGGDTWNEVTAAQEIPEQVMETDASGAYKSYEVMVKGSDESSDDLNIICRNYMKAELPNPTILPTDDKLVIDYGLPVNIPDVTSNDIFRGSEKKIIAISGEGIQIEGTKNADFYTEEPTANLGSNLKYGTAELNSDGSITYTLNKQMTGVEVIEYVVYAKASDNQYAAAIGRIYIIPATTMYYEENFGNLVTFGTKGSAWVSMGTADSNFQETGIVGTISDSPYGSDVAYLYDSGDSNGTSMYVNTEKGAASFSYTFTGTGTSIFARTSTNSAYLRITVKDETGAVVDQRYRDTYYAVEDKGIEQTLYNVPIYTLEKGKDGQSLAYGTYTVTVEIARKTVNGDKVLFHSDFYLDGIRVKQPLNLALLEEEETPEAQKTLLSIAETAYATDGESNMVTSTLRDKLLTKRTDETRTEYLDWNSGFVVFTDTNGAITSAEDYKSIGPKEEVYLKAATEGEGGQSVSFALKDWNANEGYRVFLGMKAPEGTATVKIGGTNLELNNAADCYYEISKYGIISDQKDEDGSVSKVITFNIQAVNGLVSLTNIKVTGPLEFTIMDDINVEQGTE